jgi:hypothetical protein
MDRGAKRFIMPPRLLQQLGLADAPAYIPTLGLDSQAMAHTSKSQKTAFTVQYMDHLSPVEELEVLVVPRQAYDLVLELP